MFQIINPKQFSLNLKDSKADDRGAEKTKRSVYHSNKSIQNKMEEMKNKILP